MALVNTTQRATILKKRKVVLRAGPVVIAVTGSLSVIQSTLKKIHGHKKALAYLLNAQTIGEERKDLNLLQRVSADLDTAYQELSDFKNAYMQSAILPLQRQLTKIVHRKRPDGT